MKLHTDRRKMKEEYEELIIRMALDRYAEEHGENLLKENELLKKDKSHLPSEASRKAFKRKLDFQYNRKRLMKTLNKKVGTRIAIVFLLFVATFSVSVVSVEAFRIKLYNFFVDIKVDHAEVRLVKMRDNETSKFREGEFIIEVPFEYELYQVQRIKSSLTATYKNRKNEIIIFEQSTGHVITNVDSEETDVVSDVSVQGHKGFYSKKVNIISLIWSNNERVFYISSNSNSISKNDLIRIGESIKVK
ncbi:DUF4367 domain-containing protein [Paenibacillus jiagnxiensis]|uniref:DUF4367 domain-containing protein n=1 Tax=Paenibacillus jiagnxiensis TaxID=3228926 RepID=UPI00346B980E